MSELSSAPVPPPGPDDHVRGDDGALLIEYADYECPFCAALQAPLADLGVRLVFRHFPVRSSHPRAWAAAAAAEAAGAQGAFWPMHDLLLADQARLADPHLWQRARTLGLDLERFDADRRSVATSERITRDFRAGIRAGVVSTPTVFAWTSGAAHRVDRDDLESELARVGVRPAAPPRGLGA